MMKRADALGLRRRKTGFEAQYVTDDEFVALGRALDNAGADHPVVVAMVRFLLCTGARKSLALQLKWASSRRLRGAEGRQDRAAHDLALPTRAVLAARQRRTDCPGYSRRPVTVDGEWNAIPAAGLPTLRIHDLRHSHAAVAIGGGEGLRVVAGLLGHADIKTNLGDAHLAAS